MLITQKSELEKFSAPYRLWQGIPSIEVTANGRIFLAFSHMYVYEENKRVLGIIGYYILFDDAQVTTIAVLKEARGKGIATKMMEAMIKDCNSKMCSQLSLEVRQSNQKAINLYEKFDFIEMNIRKAYYEDGEDAIFMMRALGGNYD